MTDLIDRQAAIDAINEQINQPIANDVTAWGLMVARDCIIAKLPSAQPERKNRCPICGGTLSEVRKQGGRKWQHCFSCHMEQEVKNENI